MAGQPYTIEILRKCHKKCTTHLSTFSLKRHRRPFRFSETTRNSYIIFDIETYNLPYRGRSGIRKFVNFLIKPLIIYFRYIDRGTPMYNHKLGTSFKAKRKSIFILTTIGQVDTYNVSKYSTRNRVAKYLSTLDNFQSVPSSEKVERARRL